MKILKPPLLIALGLATVLAGCSTAPQPASRADGPAARPCPVAPRLGEPIDAGGLHAFLENATTRLFHEGKLGTNLLQQLDGRKCRLSLAACPSQPLAAAELAEKLERSVAVVAMIAKAQDGSYYVARAVSGFFISESGALVTCRMPMGKNLMGMAVLTRDGRVYPVREVLAGGPGNGLVILQVEGQGFTPLPIAATAPQGEPIQMLGHSDGRFFELTSGVVSGYQKLGDWTFLMVNAEFASGAEGAPVVDRHGAVVGVAGLTAPLFYPGTRQRQMVFRLCLPAAMLQALIQQEEK